MSSSRHHTSGRVLTNWKKLRGGQQWLGDHKPSPIRKYWKNWPCLVLSKEEWKEIWYYFSNIWKTGIHRRGRFCSQPWQNAEHNNRLKLHAVKFWLNIRKNVRTVRAVQQWNQLPREMVSAPTLEAFKRNPDNHFADTLWLVSLYGFISLYRPLPTSWFCDSKVIFNTLSIKSLPSASHWLQEFKIHYSPWSKSGVWECLGSVQKTEKGWSWETSGNTSLRNFIETYLLAH